MIIKSSLQLTLEINKHSVEIFYGLNSTWTKEEMAHKLRQEQSQDLYAQRNYHIFSRCYTSQEANYELINFIFRKHDRVEPSRIPPHMPIRCKKCQSYNSHPTYQCINQPRMWFL